MFPRIVTVRKPNKNYQYLVISESVRIKGKGSTTRNIANLGNIEKFQTQDIASLIDGFIRLFELDQYALTEDVEILESLEHGSILLWQKLWARLGLSEIIARQIRLHDEQVALEVGKYIELMVVNRCVDPLSKLGATRRLSQIRLFVAIKLLHNHCPTEEISKARWRAGWGSRVVTVGWPGCSRNREMSGVRRRLHVERRTGCSS